MGKLYGLVQWDDFSSQKTMRWDKRFVGSCHGIRLDHAIGSYLYWIMHQDNISDHVGSWNYMKQKESGIRTMKLIMHQHHALDLSGSCIKVIHWIMHQDHAYVMYWMIMDQTFSGIFRIS